MANDVYGFIPARGGSLGVPNKNMRTVGGTPLVVRAYRVDHVAAGPVVPGAEAWVQALADRLNAGSALVGLRCRVSGLEDQFVAELDQALQSAAGTEQQLRTERDALQEQVAAKGPVERVRVVGDPEGGGGR